MHKPDILHFPVYFHSDDNDSYSLQHRRACYFRIIDTVTTLNIASYCDCTPLSVDPRVSIEYVMDFFRKLGPRVIIIKQKGLLVGLISKKDLLRAIDARPAI